MDLNHIQLLPDPWECIPYGPDAILLRFTSTQLENALDMTRQWMNALERDPLPQVKEATPAFGTVLLEFTSPVDSDILQAIQLFHRRFSESDRKEAPTIPALKEIPVRYDGPDLDRVCEYHGLKQSEIRDLHADTTYTVEAIGFSPGFPYLGPLNTNLHTPRLDNPRHRIEAGSVAIGGEHTGIYSISSPGGWNIIGHTDQPLVDWKALRNPSPSASSFYLQVGDQVRFQPVNA